MAWSLGEDSFDWSHIRAMSSELAKSKSKGGGASGASGQDTAAVDAAPDVAAPALSPSKPSSPSPPPPSKSPLPVVWVDGTPDGPAGDHVTESAAPEDFTVPVPVAVRPAPAPASVPVEEEAEAEASTPQQKTPLHPIQDDAGATSAQGDKGDLPFSPEYLAAIKAAGVGKGRRVVRGGAWEVEV